MTKYSIDELLDMVMGGDERARLAAKEAMACLFSDIARHRRIMEAHGVPLPLGSEEPPPQDTAVGEFMCGVQAITLPPVELDPGLD